MRIRFMMAGAAMSVLGLAGGATDGAAQTDTTPPQPSQTEATVPQDGAPPETPVLSDGQRTGSKEIVELKDVHALIGKEVRSNKGEHMGRVINVLVDGTGKPRAAVIDFGGFLGVGIRKIAVDWEALQFSPYETYERVIVALTRDQVRAAPEFKDDQQHVLAVGVAGATGP
jgi:sporulation protein YlmC with PRC-barrel domain